MIRSATPDDAAGICAIYNPYVVDTPITFEEQPVAEAEMRRRIGEVTESLVWLVAEEAGRIAGYAYAASWRARSAYRFSVESTVYVAPDAQRGGLGTQLYRELLARLRAQGRHTVVGGIALPNPASVALHEKLGFVPVAQFREVGRKFDQWIDVGYWQRML